GEMIVNRTECGFSFRLTYRHYYLLQAYSCERSKTQVQKAVEYSIDERLNMGRHILPITQELIDWGLIARTNPDAPSSLGHKSLITQLGKQVLNCYMKKFEQISLPNEKYGF
ncbi:MAG: hypothetical protein AAGJ80_17780, partial [Cyanobacteria bacterium J06553_1]